MASLPTSITTSVTPTQPPVKESPGRSLAWSVHLARRQPRRLPRIAAALGGTFLLGLCLFHSVWLALLPVIAFVFSLSDFLFPVRYRLTAQGASARHGLTHLEICWADVRHAYLTDEGIKLSPLRVRNSRFEALRGVYLRFDESNREGVIAAIQGFRQEGILHV